MWSIFKYFRNLWARMTGKVDRAADAVMYNNVDGIKTTYQQALKSRSEKFNTLLQSVGTVQGIINGKIETRKRKMEELKKAQAALEGALTHADLAEANGGTTVVDGKTYTLADIGAKGQKFQTRVDALTAEIEALGTQITTDENKIKGLKRQLETMKEEIANLPKEEAEHLAEFISDEAMTAAFRQINGILTDAAEEDPLVALRQARQKKHGEATVAADMAGVLTTNDEETFAAVGTQTEGANKFEELRRARAAEKAVKTGGGAGTTTEKPAGTTGGDEPKF